MTPEEIKNHLEELDDERPRGPKKTSPCIMKEAAAALCIPLAVVFTSSIEMGELPDIWKTANVVAIY